MEFVRQVTYTDVNGDEHEDEEVPAADIDTIAVNFSCPLCGDEKTYESEYPLPDDDTYTCPSCDERFYMMPVVGRGGTDLRDMSTSERIDYQLVSVADMHTIEERYPGDMAEMTTSIRTIMAGGSGVTLGVLGIVLQLSQTAQFLGMKLFFTLGTIILATALIAGIISLSVGAGGTLLTGYRVYKRSDAAYSFSEFLRRAGNYYNRRPFVRN